MFDIQANLIYMESSTNLHHQVQEEQLVVTCSNSSASSFPCSSSSCFSVPHNHHPWRTTPTFFLNNNGNIHASCGDDEGNPNSLNNNPIIQEMEFPWPNDDISINQSHHHQHQHHHHQQQQQQQLITDRIKEEPSSSTTSADHHHHHHHHHHHEDRSNFSKFSDMLRSSSSSSITSPIEMLLLKNTLSTTTYKNLHQPPPFPPNMQHYQNNANNNNNNNNNNKGISTTFSQIFPSVNISNNNNNNGSAAIISTSSSIDQMASNVPGGFDLFATARLLSGETTLNQAAPSSSSNNNNNNNNSNNNLLELFEGSPQFSVDHDLQQQQHPNDLQLCNLIANNVSSFNNNGSQAEHQMTTKKQRFESRASCLPLKVRKEKLGDRIAALQQLVSPFGKTDTASVLMEAIGYIKFLQNQVETLSVPYMKLASCSKSTNIQRVEDDECCESEETILRDDLRSRGLCLVPTSCMSYINIASETINGGIWPPNNIFNPASGF